MKRVIKATTASHYESRFPVNHGSEKYFCYMHEDDSPFFECELHKVSPYDDADYAWAKMSRNGQVVFYKSGKVVDKMQMHSYDYDEYDSYDEYVDDVLDSIVVELININKDVKPVMVHN